MTSRVAVVPSALHFPPGAPAGRLGAGRAALTGLDQAPDDSTAADRLQTTLRDALDADPAFAQRLIAPLEAPPLPPAPPAEGRLRTVLEDRDVVESVLPTRR
ncbi:hypothetical protein [Streptomyces sp. NBC_01506]|uniref:hypothetical protein n=1 Tax=Streptomyces sp. NBC_01506 TaxID=2903887 RepID=UPI00386D5701